MLDKQQFNRFFFGCFLGYTELCFHHTQEYLNPFSNQEAPQKIICRSSDCKQSINDEDLKSEKSLLSSSLEDNHVFSRTFIAPHSSCFLLTIWPGVLNQPQLTSCVFSLKLCIGKSPKTSPESPKLLQSLVIILNYQSSVTSHDKHSPVVSQMFHLCPLRCHQHSPTVKTRKKTSFTQTKICSIGVIP